MGKTEVRCTDEESLRTLKANAESIKSSAIYPAFEAGYRAALFFFDVRPEFVQWLNEYVRAAPPVAPAYSKTVQNAPAKRDPFRWAAVLLVFFLLAGAGFAWHVEGNVHAAQQSAEVAIPPAGNDTAPEPPLPVPLGDTTSPDQDDTTTTTGPNFILIEDTSARTQAGDLNLWFVDVGQGDGIIIRTPTGKFIVVDANARYGPKMVGLLKSLGARKIHAIVMSHPHADHIGGLTDILEEFQVGTFYDPGFPHTTRTYERVLEAVVKNGCDYVIPETGDKLEWDESLGVTVLHSGTEEKGHANNSSIVLRIVFGGTSFVLTGDAEWQVETELVERLGAAGLRSDVLKVGHHGSRSSSIPDFIKAVSPSYGIISVGTKNRYDHPRPETLETLDQHNVKIYRTDQDGTVHVQSDGKTLRISTEKKGGN